MSLKEREGMFSLKEREGMFYIAQFLYGFLPGLHGQLISVTYPRRTARRSHTLRPGPRHPKTTDRGEIILGTLSKPRRQRQRENKTKGLMSRTIAVHVRYNSLYISSPSYAKQQREMTKFWVFWTT